MLIEKYNRLYCKQILFEKQRNKTYYMIRDYYSDSMMKLVFSIFTYTGILAFLSLFVISLDKYDSSMFLAKFICPLFLIGSVVICLVIPMFNKKTNKRLISIDESIRKKCENNKKELDQMDKHMDMLFNDLADFRNLDRLNELNKDFVDKIIKSKELSLSGNRSNKIDMLISKESFNTVNNKIINI